MMSEIPNGTNTILLSGMAYFHSAIDMDQV